MAPSLVCQTGNQKEAVIAREKTRMATPTALNGRSHLVPTKGPGKALQEQESLLASNASPDGGRTRLPMEKCSQPSGVVPAAGSTEGYGDPGKARAPADCVQSLFTTGGHHGIKGCFQICLYSVSVVRWHHRGG